MFLWIVALLALVISIFGLYAFVHIMTQSKSSSSGNSLISMKEMAGLDPEIQKLYEKTTLNILVPSWVSLINAGYKSLRETKTYAEVEKELMAQATDAATTIRGMTDMVKENAKNGLTQTVMEAFTGRFTNNRMF